MKSDSYSELEKLEKIRVRSRELNQEFYEQRKKMNFEEFEVFAAFVFMKIAAFEIENENLKQEIEIIRGKI